MSQSSKQNERDLEQEVARLRAELAEQRSRTSVAGGGDESGDGDDGESENQMEVEEETVAARASKRRRAAPSSTANQEGQASGPAMIKIVCNTAYVDVPPLPTSQQPTRKLCQFPCKACVAKRQPCYEGTGTSKRCQACYEAHNGCVPMGVEGEGSSVRTRGSTGLKGAWNEMAAAAMSSTPSGSAGGSVASGGSRLAFQNTWSTRAAGQAGGGSLPTMPSAGPMIKRTVSSVH